MKTTYSSSAKLFKIPRSYFLIVVAIFLAIYIALHIKLNKYPHLPISTVFLFAAYSTLKGSLIFVVIAVALFGLFYNFLIDFITSPKSKL